MCRYRSRRVALCLVFACDVAVIDALQVKLAAHVDLRRAQMSSLQGDNGSSKSCMPHVDLACVYTVC